MKKTIIILLAVITLGLKAQNDTSFTMIFDTIGTGRSFAADKYWIQEDRNFIIKNDSIGYINYLKASIKNLEEDNKYLRSRFDKVCDYTRKLYDEYSNLYEYQKNASLAIRNAINKINSPIQGNTKCTPLKSGLEPKKPVNWKTNLMQVK